MYKDLNTQRRLARVAEITRVEIWEYLSHKDSI